MKILKTKKAKRKKVEEIVEILFYAGIRCRGSEYENYTEEEIRRVLKKYVDELCGKFGEIEKPEIWF